MKIKVLRLGHSATVIEVPAGTPIEEALESNDIPRQGYSVSVNGLGAGPAARPDGPAGLPHPPHDRHVSRLPARVRFLLQVELLGTDVL